MLSALSVFGPLEGPLLGSFTGFNQVPLLQTLEAICENTALWLQRHGIATDDCSCRLMPNSHPNYKNPFTAKKDKLSIIQKHSDMR